MTMKPFAITKFLLVLGALFFFAEFILHFFGLPILEHDKIFIFTHDRYIALYALTQAFLLALVAADLEKYRFLMKALLVGLLLGMFNAYLISAQGGYDVLFPSVRSIDADLSALGWMFVLWYAGLIAAWRRRR